MTTKNRASNARQRARKARKGQKHRRPSRAKSLEHHRPAGQRIAISDAMALVQRSLQRGELQQAELTCREILRKDAANADALQMLGLILYQAGKSQEAIQSLRNAIAINPTADAFYNLGVMQSERQQHQQAAECFQNALRLRPNNTETHNNLGNALKALGKLDDAAECYRQAIRVDANHALAHFNLGSLSHQQKRLDDAVTCYRNVLVLNPRHVEALLNLGIVLKDQGEFDEAIATCRQALKIRPDFVPAYINLANVCGATGELEEAIENYLRALEFEPQNLDALNNLATAYKSTGRSTEAVEVCRRAVESHPNAAKLYNNLGNAYLSLAMPDAAFESYRRARELDSTYISAHSNMLLASQYLPEITPQQLFEQHRQWDSDHARALKSEWKPFDQSSDPERRLRLGFVSSDFAHHPVGFFLVRFLESIDAEQFETICYSGRVVKDGMTDRIESAADIWRETDILDCEELACRIREDRVDILVDLGGHMAGDRLLVFARKPAPVQVTWIGYPGTTGLDAIDYLIGDRFHIPEGDDQFYTEDVIRLPDGHICYAPPHNAPDVRELPAIQNGYTTFASFNNPMKLTDRVVEAWSTILQRVPSSRLLLKYRGIEEPEVRQRFEERFGAHGITADRLELSGWTPFAQMMDAYNRVDLSLDPFPFCGGATSCEALWMGVPVLTLPGQTFAGRQTLSYLSNIGLTETIAESVDDYVERAVDLAGDVERLEEMRLGLRQRMADSPLCDGSKFAANLGSTLRAVWRRWCDNNGN